MKLQIQFQILLLVRQNIFPSWDHFLVTQFIVDWFQISRLCHSTVGFVIILRFCRAALQTIQSRPIEMRATILYLANHWTEFEMLLTPHRFLYLVMFSFLAFPSISQFIAHFWQICPFLCIVLPYSNSYRNESCSKACTAHYAIAATLFFSLLLRDQNGGAKKVLKSLN